MPPKRASERAYSSLCATCRLRLPEIVPDDTSITVFAVFFTSCIINISKMRKATLFPMQQRCLTLSISMPWIVREHARIRLAV